MLTNYHVVAGASTIAVTDVGNGRTYRGAVVGTDPVHDVAVVRAVGASGLSVSAVEAGPARGSGPASWGSAMRAAPACRRRARAS